MNLGHGGNVEEIARLYNLKEEDIIDFSANINPIGLSREVKEAMIQALDKVERYPDITYYELKKEIEKYESINKENILLGNGAAEVIFNIVRALKPKKALVKAPTFSEYEDALNSVSCEVAHYKLKEDFNLDSAFLEEIKEDVDIVFICNPNNPTGILTSKEYIIEAVKRAKEVDAVMVIDESFIDFIENKEAVSVIKEIEKFDNLIVVKSLTKFFAFPGIRVGYGVTNNREIRDKVNKISVPWAINTVAAYGAKKALNQKAYIEETLAYVKKEREFLFNELSSFESLKVYPGTVNFLFFKLQLEENNNKLDLKEELLKSGIIIRSCSNYEGLEEGYYRVAVRTREENTALIEALKKIF